MIHIALSVLATCVTMVVKLWLNRTARNNAILCFAFIVVQILFSVSGKIVFDLCDTVLNTDLLYVA
jgi:hypothetical protein